MRNEKDGKETNLCLVEPLVVFLVIIVGEAEKDPLSAPMMTSRQGRRHCGSLEEPEKGQDFARPVVVKRILWEKIKILKFCLILDSPLFTPANLEFDPERSLFNYWPFSSHQQSSGFIHQEAGSQTYLHDLPQNE